MLQRGGGAKKKSPDSSNRIDRIRARSAANRRAEWKAMPDSQDKQAIAAILARYERLRAEYDQDQENVERVQTHQRALLAQINDCFAAARLFGIELSQSPESVDLPRRISSRHQSIKALVLEAVRMAYPNPVRAADVRRDLASRGHIIHEKTVGMTLYRWSQKGRVRREDRDWYFIPKPGAEKLNGHHESAPTLFGAIGGLQEIAR